MSAENLSEVIDTETYGLMPDGIVPPEIKKSSRLRKCVVPAGLSILATVGILTGINQQNRVLAQEPTMVPEPIKVSTVCAQELTPVFDKDGNLLWWPNTCVPDDYKRAQYPTEAKIPAESTVCGQAFIPAYDLDGNFVWWHNTCLPEGYKPAPYPPTGLPTEIPKKEYKNYIPNVNKAAEPDYPRVGPRPRPVVPLGN